jgi:hypothetical protein
MKEKGKCTDRECGFAHFAIELDLVPLDANIKNLQGMIEVSSKKLQNMKPLEPWRPAKSGLADTNGKNQFNLSYAT